MKKFLFILISTLLIVSVLAVPCFATNEGTYGHYISPGTYVFDEDVSGYAVNKLITFDFVSNEVSFKAIYFYPDIQTLVFAKNVPVVNYTTVYEDESWVELAYREIYVSEGFYIYDSLDYSWWLSNLTRVDAGNDSSVLDELFSAFTFVGQWISGATSDLTLMFWTGTELTFVGILAVSALAFAVSVLIIGLISRFLRFRG